MIRVMGEARDGHEAVRLVETVLPDAAVFEAHMPGMDGLEATRFIKKRWPQLMKGCSTETLFEDILA